MRPVRRSARATASRQGVTDESADQPQGRDNREVDGGEKQLQSSGISSRQFVSSDHGSCSSLSRRNEPMASTSMFVRMKHVYASSGDRTIGSPWTLNDVM